MSEPTSTFRLDHRVQKQAGKTLGYPRIAEAPEPASRLGMQLRELFGCSRRETPVQRDRLPRAAGEGRQSRDGASPAGAPPPRGGSGSPRPAGCPRWQLRGEPRPQQSRGSPLPARMALPGCVSLALPAGAGAAAARLRGAAGTGMAALLRGSGCPAAAAEPYFRAAPARGGPGGVTSSLGRGGGGPWGCGERRSGRTAGQQQRDPAWPSVLREWGMLSPLAGIHGKKLRVGMERCRLDRRDRDSSASSPEQHQHLRPGLSLKHPRPLGPRGYTTVRFCAVRTVRGEGKGRVCSSHAFGLNPFCFSEERRPGTAGVGSACERPVQAEEKQKHSQSKSLLSAMTLRA